MYLAILQEEGDFEGNLTDQQWKIIHDLKTLLQPFMIAQRLLEGESYVTISLVPFMIYKIRKDLRAAVDDELSSAHVVGIGTRMLEKMNEIFGSGEEGTVAYNVFDEGNRRRPKGIPQLTLMASLLDPRMKAGIGIPPMDKGHLWRMIKDEAVRIAREDLVLGQQQQQQHDGGGEPQQQRPNPNQPIYDNMFEEINNNFLLEQQRHNENARGDNDDNNNAEVVSRQHQEHLRRISETADAEALLFAREPSIPLQNEQQRFTCPLNWWKLNQTKYKLLSEVALRLLCIPATSAPSERVFSVAGLTIAKDRARMAPQTANELIFLHDAIPAIRHYKDTRANL
jgi:hypothetical protein